MKRADVEQQHERAWRCIEAGGNFSSAELTNWILIWFMTGAWLETHSVPRDPVDTSQGKP